MLGGATPRTDHTVGGIEAFDSIGQKFSSASCLSRALSAWPLVLVSHALLSCAHPVGGPLAEHDTGQVGISAHDIRHH